MTDKIVYRIQHDGVQVLTEKNFTVRRNALIAAAEIWKEKSGNVIVSAFIDDVFIGFERIITENGEFK